MTSCYEADRQVSILSRKLLSKGEHQPAVHARSTSWLVPPSEDGPPSLSHGSMPTRRCPRSSVIADPNALATDSPSPIEGWFAQGRDAGCPIHRGAMGEGRSPRSACDPVVAEPFPALRRGCGNGFGAKDSPTSLSAPESSSAAKNGATGRENVPAVQSTKRVLNPSW